MGIINKLESIEKKLGESKEKDRQKLQDMRENPEKYKKPEKPTEQSSLHKNANTVIKGVAWFWLIPVFGIAAIIGTFAIAWIWDMITGLF